MSGEKPSWLGAGKPVPGGPPNARQTADFALLTPEQQVEVAHLAQEQQHGTLRLTEATLRLEKHSRDLVRLTIVLIAVTVILAILTVVLVVRSV